jgi:hypothetical protein
MGSSSNQKVKEARSIGKRSRGLEQSLMTESLRRRD